MDKKVILKFGNTEIEKKKQILLPHKFDFSI